MRSTPTDGEIESGIPPTLNGTTRKAAPRLTTVHRAIDPAHRRHPSCEQFDCTHLLDYDTMREHLTMNGRPVDRQSQHGRMRNGRAIASGSVGQATDYAITRGSSAESYGVRPDHPNTPSESRNRRWNVWKRSIGLGASSETIRDSRLTRTAICPIRSEKK